MTPIISKLCRIRHPEHFTVGNFSIVDDFSYFSTKVIVGKFSHIASNCTVAGGKEHTFTMKDYCTLSTGARVLCATDDFVNDIGNILPESITYIKNHVIHGDVTFENAVTVGANTVIMPGNHIPEGTVIGAMSFVPPNFQFEPWSVYVGLPEIRKIKDRNKENVMREIAEIEIYYEDVWRQGHTIP